MSHLVLSGGTAGLWVEGLLLVAEEIDGAGREREVVLALDQAKGAGSPDDDVEPPVLQALDDPLDLTRTPDLLELLIGEPQDPELAVLAVQAVLDHLPVAILEDVKRHALPGQRHDPQGEQR